MDTQIHLSDEPGKVDGISIKVNGEVFPVGVTKSNYISWEGEWQDGDIVEYDIPMSVRIEAVVDGEQINMGVLESEEMNKLET